jgi:hypothetical protein
MIKLLLIMALFPAVPAFAIESQDCEAGLTGLKLELLEKVSDQHLRDLICYGSRQNGVLNWARRNHYPRPQARLLFSALIQNLIRETELPTQRLKDVADDVRIATMKEIASHPSHAEFIFQYILTETPDPPDENSPRFTRPDLQEMTVYQLLNMNVRGVMSMGSQGFGPKQPLTRMYEAFVKSRPPRDPEDK